MEFGPICAQESTTIKLALYILREIDVSDLKFIYLSFVIEYCVIFIAFYGTYSVFRYTRSIDWLFLCCSYCLIVQTYATEAVGSSYEEICSNVELFSCADRRTEYTLILLPPLARIQFTSLESYLGVYLSNVQNFKVLLLIHPFQCRA